MSDSTPRRVRVKPKKPYADFPLFPHASGQWAKKIHGETKYFGVWEDPDAAKRLYDLQAGDLHAGREPTAAPDSLTVGILIATFLSSKRVAVAAGELSPRSLSDYHNTCDRIVAVFGARRPVTGLGPADFAKLRADLASTSGLVRLGNQMTQVKMVMRAARGIAIDFGDAFGKPTRKSLRLERAKRPARMFTAVEIRKMVREAGQPLRAMILLGVNCGFGNRDVGSLTLDSLDLKRGWHTFARPKTGVERRCPLWPETVAAVKAWLKVRPAAKGVDDALVFVTAKGASWAKDTRDNPLSKELRKVMDACGISGAGRNFYALRHVTQTIGDETLDFVAVRRIMGHAGRNISDEYREVVDDRRLRRVTDHVRTWLDLNRRAGSSTSAARGRRRG